MQAKDAHHSSRRMRASDGGLMVMASELRMASQFSNREVERAEWSGRRSGRVMKRA
jgi:hypothetical protein